MKRAIKIILFLICIRQVLKIVIPLFVNQTYGESLSKVNIAFIIVTASTLAIFLFYQRKFEVFGEDNTLIRFLFGIPFLIILCLSLSIYSIYFSPKGVQAATYLQNSKRLKIGMTIKETLKIMGNPTYTKPPTEKGASQIYYYQYPLGASSGVNVFLDSTGRVAQVKFN